MQHGMTQLPFYFALPPDMTCYLPFWQTTLWQNDALIGII